MNSYQLIAGSLIVFISFGLKAVTGLGAALVCVPLLSLLIDIKTVVPLELIFEVFFGAVIIIKIWGQVKKDILVIMITSSFVGVMVGSKILAYASQNSLRIILSALIFIFAIKILFPASTRSSIKKTPNIPFGLLCGFAGGSIGGVTGQQGPPIAIYTENQIEDRGKLRSTLIAIFFINDILRCGVYTAQGLFTQELLTSALYFLPALIAAVICGSTFHLKINEVYFNRIVAGILICSAVFLVIPALKGN